MDDIVKIIDVSQLASRAKEDFDEDEYERDITANPKRTKRSKPKKAAVEVEDAQMEEEEERKGGSSSSDSDDGSDWESEDSDDSGEGRRDGKKDNKLNVKGINVQVSKKMLEAEKKKDFFSGL